MDPSFRTRGHEFRSDGLLRLLLGWRQRNAEVVKRGGRTRGTTPFVSVHRSSAVAELYAAAFGSVSPEHDV